MHDRYLIIPAFLAPDETDALLNRAKSLLDEFSLQDHPLVRLKIILLDHQILITFCCTLSSSYPRLGRGLFLQTKFTTGDKDHVGDDYFLTSGDKIRYFLEEDATDGQGNLTREKHKAVNKIGHGILSLILFSVLVLFPHKRHTYVTFPGLHELDPVFRRATLQNEKLRSLVRDLRFHYDPVGMYCYRNPFDP
jgi:phytanoyl-CoA hydroxylase